MLKNICESVRRWITDKTNWIMLGTNAYLIYKMAKSYPTVKEEDALRAWLGAVLSKGGELAELTETKVDDTLISTARVLVDDAESWIYIYGLLIKSASIKELPTKWDKPESIAGIIAAIGLITQLIAKIREELQISEYADCYAAQKKREAVTNESMV